MEELRQRTGETHFLAPAVASRRARVKAYFRTGFRRWSREFYQCRYLVASSLAVALVAMYVDYRCGVYVSSIQGPDVPDLILDHFGPVDLSPLFVYGYFALVSFLFAYPVVFRTPMFHFVLVQFGLLLTLRSFFMVFTHLQTPSDAIAGDFPWIFEHLNFQNDLFFSGHTAIPFLGFFLFRDSGVRYIFLVGSVVMATVVLAMHRHYSIDVLAAFFFTYCSYRMGCFLMRKIGVPAQV
jgi:hypothetical protein